jgi:hypothetical protein
VRIRLRKQTVRSRLSGRTDKYRTSEVRIRLPRRAGQNPGDRIPDWEDRVFSYVVKVV